MILPAMRNLPATVSEIAAWIGGTVEGDGALRIAGLAAMDSAAPGELTYAADDKHAAHLGRSKASAAIVGRQPASARMTLIRVADVQSAVAKLLAHVSEPEDLPPAGRHPTAIVAPDAIIAADAAIGPGVVVGPRARIGAGSVLCANVTVGQDARIGDNTILFEGVAIKARCVVGDRVRIGPNSVVGWDGFGYFFARGVHHKIPHAGNVVIEDDVEIGACSCVDRAKFGSTRIGAGTKIDNLVQVAHNVQIGQGCILAGQCGVAGSARLGNYVLIGGNAGIRDNVSLGDGVQCSAFAAVAQDVEAGQAVAGVPASPAREQYRMVQALTRLPDLLKRVKELESRLKEIESPKDH
ncbi:MAG: UDP-3-O-(3-hydroxymyristoyl)glucosamine N-acyltransferase [Phycisphaerae bacterium]